MVGLVLVGALGAVWLIQEMTSKPVPQSVVDEIVASDGFEAGQTVAL